MAKKIVKDPKSKVRFVRQLHSGAASAGQHSWSKIYWNDLVAAGKKFQAMSDIESGLSVKIVDELGDLLELPPMAIRTITRISPSTFGRRQKAGFLSPEESDRVYRLQIVIERVIDFYEGNVEAARRWLNTPAPALGGVRPVSMLGNEAGVREVESLLNRLDQGVFT
jgi:putative toxin-antitoxin system antitoxin component (TIGR02293 family)